ncbi:MAG TPA: hypothetical protein VI818_03645 [Candidatus Thermoplasmatota archaeon]|nr:hypothetical protein [Candidatus Thermoplasmatota archaeon]
MALGWNVWGFLGLVGGLFAIALALVVYVYNPRRARNLWLGLALFFEGSSLATGGGLMYMAQDAASAYAYQAVAIASALPLPSLYLLFLSHLNNPWTRPLRSTWVRGGLVGLIGVLEIWWFARHGDFLRGLEAPPYAYALWEGDVAAPLEWVYRALFLVFVYGLVVSASMYREAPSRLAKRRARALLVAFLARDVVAGFGRLAYILVLSRAAPTDPVPWILALVLTSVHYFVFYGGLAYGIIRSNLFDVRLRVRWTVRQGTVAAFFVAVPFVVSQTVQEVFDQAFGPYLGILTAGVLVFFLAPIQRVAERVARATVPPSPSISHMAEGDRRKLFQEQVEIAWQDGSLTVKERQLLDRLRERLGLANDVAADIERGTVAKAPTRGRTRRASAD